MSDFCLKIYKANTKSSPNKTYLGKSVKLTVFLFKNGMILLITTATLTSIKPCILYILTGELDPILPTHFPGINEQEAIGYTILAVFHLYIMFVFAVGTAGVDLSLMTFVIHTYTMSNIFKNAVNDLNGLIGLKARNNDIRSSLNNLILMHNDFIKLPKLGISLIIYNYNDVILDLRVF